MKTLKSIRGDSYWQMFFIAAAGHRMYKTKKGFWLPERMLEMNRDEIKIWKTRRGAEKAQAIILSYGSRKAQIEIKEK